MTLSRSPLKNAIAAVVLGIPMKRKSSSLRIATSDVYPSVLSSAIELIDAARRGAARAVNAVITSAYWEIGRRIVESEMRGRRRADYGEGLIDRLSVDLTQRFGRGFSRRAVYQIRAFYLAYPPIVQSGIAQSPAGAAAAGRFPLPWGRS